MRVLGIDPGYAIVGWGVVDYAGNRFAPVDFGAVCTDAGVPFERRLDEVYAGVKEVIERTQPEVLAIEKLFYQHNQTTVIGVAEARGVILLAAAQAAFADDRPRRPRNVRAIVGWLASSSVHIVLDGEKAVVLRFGKFNRVAARPRVHLAHHRVLHVAHRSARGNHVLRRRGDAHERSRAHQRGCRAVLDGV